MTKFASLLNQHTRIDPVPFVDIGAPRRRLVQSIDAAVGRVVPHCPSLCGHVGGPLAAPMPT